MSNAEGVRSSFDDLNAAIALFAGTLWPFSAEDDHGQQPPERRLLPHLTLISARPATSEPRGTGEADR